MKAYNSDITVEEFIARHAKPYDPATDNYFRISFITLNPAISFLTPLQEVA